MNRCATLTNEIDVKIDFSALVQDYAFYAIDIARDKKDKNQYQKIYGRIRKELAPAARAIIPSGKDYRYVLAFPKSIPHPPTEMDMRKFSRTELERIPKRSMFSMLLSIMVGERSYFELAGNPYDVYYAHTIKSGNMIALKVNVQSKGDTMTLLLSATNFRKARKASNVCYVEDGGVLIPYEGESHKGKNLYEKGNYKSTRITISLLSLEGKNFPQSKTCYLDLIYRDIAEVLSAYAKVDFITREITVYRDGSDKEKRKKAMNETIHRFAESIGRIHLKDLSGEGVFAEKLQHALQKQFGETIEIMLGGEATPKRVPIVTITYPKDYYKEHKEEPDPYVDIEREVPTQNITTDAKISRAVLEVLIKEIAIKCELYGYGSHLVEHTIFKEHTCYIHIENEKKGFYHKAILEGGKISTETLTLEELETTEEALVELRHGEVPEAVIISGNSIMMLSRTTLFPLPDFKALADKYRTETRNIYLPKLELFDYVVSLDKYDHTTLESFQSVLDEIETHKGVPSLKLIPRVSNRGLRNSIEEFAKRPLRFLARNKEAKTLYCGLLGITYFKDTDGTILYHTGMASGNLDSDIKKNSPYRRLTPIKGEIDLSAVLPFMEEYFVKYGDMTVLPYPLKYAREGYKIQTLIGGDKRGR